MEKFGDGNCRTSLVKSQAMLFLVWFRPNCLGSYNGLTCGLNWSELTEESAIDLEPRLMDIYFGPMAKALSIIYKTIKEREEDTEPDVEQLADFWTFLEEVFAQGKQCDPM